MPIHSNSEVIPFVNKLESTVNSMLKDLDDWKNNKIQILNSLSEVSDNTNRSLTALIKADEALTELNTATYNVVAQRGQRLKTLIEEIKASIVDIAKDAVKDSAGYDERINAEIDNAISTVDPMISDGLKLDYRLRQIQETAKIGQSLSEKALIIPYKYEVTSLPTTTFQMPEIEDIQYVDGDVTILDTNGQPILDINNEIVTGTIDSTGLLHLSNTVNQPAILYFPAALSLKNVPSDFLYFALDTLVKKNSSYMGKILDFERSMNDLMKDIQSMKGQDWTKEFSIMKNHQDIIKESITPKGLNVEVKDGIAYATFSYNDNEYLSHFILEKWDDQAKQWVPYDGKNGILMK